MKKRNLFLVAAVGTMAFSLFSAVLPDMVISVDGAALLKHPQAVKYRSEFDGKAEASGEKTLSQLLAGEKLSEEMLQSRISFYLNLQGQEGVIVIDTPEGKASELFEPFVRSMQFKDGGEKAEISGCQAVTGITGTGKPGAILLRSPSQIQIQLDGSGALPLDFSKVSKNLILAAKSDRLASLAFVPPVEILNNPTLPPQLQALRLLTLGVTGTEPEAELEIAGQFADEQSALAAKGMVDMMIFAFQQNPDVDKRLLENVKSDVAGGKVSLRRPIDQTFLDAMTQLVRDRLAAPPAPAPAPAAAKIEKANDGNAVPGTAPATQCGCRGLTP